ncbi:spore germination protein [Bacillus sp. CH30_1T]|uniref:spore germination protein n=1 Tax=Bacillus sp. CH30_1T TaxID=2604836 RepID=UPI0011ED2EBF|nr:spore germination protein [Bacillus sp. CH30_1T]KAA0566688.1 spore germination protein [Bacillus sp. CH30_1T]
MVLFSNKNKIQKKQATGKDSSSIPISPSLDNNIRIVKQLLNESDDLKEQDIQLPSKQAKLLYIETITDTSVIQEQILSPIQHHSDHASVDIFPSREMNKRTDLHEVASDLLHGRTALILENERFIYTFDTKSQYLRSIEEPNNEKVIRGAHYGFIENVNVNINLIRSRIANKNLVIKNFMIGDEVKTKVSIVFMKNIVNPKLVSEVETRLQSIHMDIVTSPGYIEEFIEDSPFSPFPQMLTTQRPDRVAYNLMEGRVAILSEGSPNALILPITFFGFFQSPDDYNSRWYVGSFYRLLRFISFVMAITLPAIYISIVAFHFEVLPTKMLKPIKESIELIPYPPLIEATIMELTIELIREAGVRLPSSIGPVIGIVGGLVIGQAAVEAHLVSNIMVIIVAITAIASFVVPSNEMVTTLRLLRFPLMIVAASFGFLGIILGLTVMLMHMCTLQSFGTPYLAPISVGRWTDFKDTWIRVPIWKMNRRPKDPQPQQLDRESDSRRWKKE